MVSSTQENREIKGMLRIRKSLEFGLVTLLMLTALCKHLK